MQSIKNYHIWIIFGLVCCLPALGYAFSATAQVDRTRISPGEAVTFQVTVDGGDGQVDLSGIQDFEVVSSGTQTSRSYINGQWSHQVAYNYMLVPKHTGVVTIPALPVVKGPDKTMTREIKILVSGDDTAKGQPSPYFAKAQLSQEKTVTGQQTVYTLKLYAARQFSGASFDPPGFQGLTARELTQWQKSTEQVNGVTYRVNEIKYLVQGETPGTYDIAPAIFVAREPLSGRRRSNDPFDSFFNDSFFNTRPTKPVRVVSNPVTLTISRLPEYTGSDPFSGLVGEFTMAAELDKPNIQAGESVTLTITIQGRGNVMDAGIPRLNLPADRFKVYQDTPVEEVTATAQGFAGKKVFKQALVPNSAGDTTIGPFHLIYYDVGTGTYEQTSTAPLHLTVVPGGGPATLVQSGAGPAAPDPSGAAGDASKIKQAVVLKNKDVLDIRSDISGIRTDSPLSLPLFVVLVLLPAAGFAGFAGALQLRGREKSVAEQQRARANVLVAAAQKAGSSAPEFLSHLQSALVAAVLARGNQVGTSLTRQEVRSILTDAHTNGRGHGKDDAGHTVLDQVIGLMDTLDSARFGGQVMDEAKAQQCLSRVRRLIKTLVVVLCLTGVVGFHPARALALAQDQDQDQDPASLFVDGARAYQAQDYQGAVEKFEAVAALGVKNPDLFYNLGNAYLKAHDLGRAVLWYERAKRLAPNDPDLKFNLAHALAQVKDKRETQVSITDILFFWQGLVSLRLMQLLCIAGSVVFFVWAGVRTFQKKSIFSGAGMVLALVLVLLLGATGLETYRLYAEHRAVIVKETVAVRSGTTDKATLLFDLHAGTRVRVLDKKDSHFKIRFAPGKVGWVDGRAAEII